MTAAEPATDAAWVAIDVPLEPQALSAFCQDLERLYRINPYLVINSWQNFENGRIRAVFRNLSNQRDFDLQISPESSSDCSFTIRYDHGAKRSTRFDVEATPGGSRLTITDDYTPAYPGAPTDPDEADKSLQAWGVALRAYLIRENRWGKLAIWRWFMRRIWLPMKPAARRITIVILVVTLAEVALFALVMAIYWIEQQN